MTEYHLDMDVEHENAEIDNRAIKIALLRRIYLVLGKAGCTFHARNIQIGVPAPCSVCKGTGMSTYPSDSDNVQ